MSAVKKVSLKKVVGKGYTEFWNCKKRYIALKGGRGSKKSKTTALRWIYLLMKYPLSNLLVVRKVRDTLKDSCFSDLKWATEQLNVSDLWKFQVSPLQATFIPTGQKILFRGLDSPLKITSITVERGHLNFCWFEECFEILKEDDFDKIDMSIRGELPDGYFKQIVLSFNPGSEKHWLKSRFFDNPDERTMALTTNYLLNEFLGEDDLQLFEWMKKNKPRRYHVEGLGNWGIADGTIYEGWEEKAFNIEELAQRPGIVHRCGLDFGYVADETAFISVLVDMGTKEMFICDEHYEKGMTNNKISEMIHLKGYAKSFIKADSAEPKSIDEIRLTGGILGLKAATKGPDSINNGIQFVNQFKIYVHPRCTNAIIELSNYVWDKNKEGRQINKPIDDYNHLMDALRYAVEDLARAKDPRIRSL
ncbi:terminase large subunit [Bacillus phage Silence]|nr:terminase large subunit [Bacillus phage Silence]